MSLAFFGFDYKSINKVIDSFVIGYIAAKIFDGKSMTAFCLRAKSKRTKLKNKSRKTS